MPLRSPTARQQRNYGLGAPSTSLPAQTADAYLHRCRAPGKRVLSGWSGRYLLGAPHRAERRGRRDEGDKWAWIDAESLTNHEVAESLYVATDLDACPPRVRATPPANMA